MATFNELLDGWYQTEIALLFRNRDPGEGKVLLGCPVWGKEYTERLLNWCLPTLMSTDNLAALAGRARLALLVDPFHSTDIAFVIRGLEQKGIEIRLLKIPEEILKQWSAAVPEIRQGWTYKILGTAQDILVQMAGRGGLDFHMIMPDHGYNARYFPNYFRLAKVHRAIAQLGICADMDAATMELDAFRQEDGSLAVPDRDLGDIAYRNLHRRMQDFQMDDGSFPDRMPKSHFLFWQGRDRLFLSSCHMNAAHLSARICQVAPKFMPATMDACLPALIGTACHVPTADDGLTFIELSDRKKHHTAGHVGVGEFVRNAWVQARFRDDYLWYTRQLCEIPIKPQPEYMADDLIAAQHQQVIDTLVVGRGTGAALEIVQDSFRREGVPQ